MAEPTNQPTQTEARCSARTVATITVGERGAKSGWFYCRLPDGHEGSHDAGDYRWLASLRELSQRKIADLAARLVAAETQREQAVKALEVYADPRNWGISEDDFRHKVVAWIGPGSDHRPVPDAPRTARAALAGLAADRQEPAG